MSIRESDWKIFKQVRAEALERLSQRVLDECQTISTSSGSAHERYLNIYSLIHERDKQIAEVFNSYSRSSALLSLLGMRTLNLLTEEEISQFTDETQHFINVRR